VAAPAFAAPAFGRPGFLPLRLLPLRLFRIYSKCERKEWSQEAMAYNSLVVAWSELTKLALAARTRTGQTQQEMF